jgi:teichuronic acid biosynthesis glycosyltransferase TuaC
MLRVLTLSTLFPDRTRATFGGFVERQTMGLAAHPDVELQVMAPLGIAPFGKRHAHYRALAALPRSELWRGMTVHRPRFHHVPGVNGRFDGMMLARALIRPLRALREQFPFDVIDAEFFFPDGPAAVRLGAALGVPVSIKARGSDIHRWAAGGATQRQILSAAKAADGLLCVSKALRDDMIALGMPAETIAVHYTGVDHDLFTVRDRAAAKQQMDVAGPLIVSIGALIERKGQQIVIEALRAIPHATLVIVGHGPDRARFEQAAIDHGVSDRVRFTGVQAHDRIAAWLAAADVMVLMSVSEGLANAWVEAIASGVPIVIPDIGGAREVIDRPEHGRLVTRDARSVAVAVNALLADPPARTAVATGAAKFSWDKNTAQLYAHLNALKFAASSRA